MDTRTSAMKRGGIAGEAELSDGVGLWARGGQRWGLGGGEGPALELVGSERQVRVTDGHPDTGPLGAAGRQTSDTSTQTFCFDPFTDQVCEFWVFRSGFHGVVLTFQLGAISSNGLGSAHTLTGGTDFPATGVVRELNLCRIYATCHV